MPQYSPSPSSADPTVDVEAAAPNGDAAADSDALHSDAARDQLENLEFLDDVDFTLEDVESTIAPLALAHG